MYLPLLALAKTAGEISEIIPRPTEFSTFVILEPHVCY